LFSEIKQFQCKKLRSIFGLFIKIQKCKLLILFLPREI